MRAVELKPSLSPVSPSLLRKVQLLLSVLLHLRAPWPLVPPRRPLLQLALHLALLPLLLDLLPLLRLPLLLLALNLALLPQPLDLLPLLRLPLLLLALNLALLPQPLDLLPLLRLPLLLLALNLALLPLLLDLLPLDLLPLDLLPLDLLSLLLLVSHLVLLTPILQPLLPRLVAPMAPLLVPDRNPPAQCQCCRVPRSQQDCHLLMDPEIRWSLRYQSPVRSPFAKIPFSRLYAR